MRSVSVSQLCNKSTNLHICGYSEEVLDNLIQNGDLQGYFDSENGETMVDAEDIMEFLPSAYRNCDSMKREQDEKANDSENEESML